ncbi:MAG: hypothetical protein AB7O62_24385 [Pirellulales bacterium]
MKSNLQTFAANPLAFIDALLIPSGDGSQAFGSIMAGFQRRDFQAMAPALLALCRGERPMPSRFWIERTKGASKDTDLAACLLWLLAFCRRPLTIQVGAADQSQADELRKAARGLLRLTPWLGEVLAVQALSIVNGTTGSRADILTADVMGSHGARPDLLILNELTHVSRREFAETLLDNASKMPSGVVIIATNAGHLETWQSEWRRTAIESERWHFSAFDQPAPWLDAAELAEARRRNSANRYARLWAGQWVAESGDALNAGDVDAAIDPALVEIRKPEPGFCYSMGVDLSLTRDHSALVVVGRKVGEVKVTRKRIDTPTNPTLDAMVDVGLVKGRAKYRRITKRIDGDGSYRLAFVRTWKPNGGKIDLSRIEETIRRVHHRFNAPLLIDQWQSAAIVERLERENIPCELIHYTPNVLGSMTQTVLAGFADRAIHLYPHDELVAQLRALRCEEKSYGVRLTSPRTKQGHGDIASAFQLAMLGAARETEPIGDDGFYAGAYGRLAW